MQQFLGIESEASFSTAVKAAIEAGLIILDIYNTRDFKVEIKTDTTPVTIADKMAHNVIVEHLKNTNFPILSEEGKQIPYEIRKLWKYLWLVDPLDGTKEFIKRNGEFTVNIALVVDGIPVLGIVYVPVADVLYFGIINKGAYKLSSASQKWNNQESNLWSIFLSTAILLPQIITKPFTVVASRSHRSDETEMFINELRTKHSDLICISKGSSLKLCVIAEGIADIYPRFGPTMEWDIAAGHALVKASGGLLFQSDGLPVIYNKENLLNPWFIASGKPL